MPQRSAVGGASGLEDRMGAAWWEHRTFTGAYCTQAPLSTFVLRSA